MTTTDPKSEAPLRWGPFELDPATRVFRRDGVEVHLQPRVFDVLAALAARLDRAVSREELLAAAWPGVTVVDNALHQVVRKVRAALDDASDPPQWLLAVPRFGYHLRGGPAPRPVSAPGDSWVGRADTLDLLLAGGPGLVTVSGPGGVGKTRLAQELSGRTPAQWVELAGVTEPLALPGLVAGAFGLTDPKHLVPALRRTAAVLVLDNAEALAGAVAAEVAAWCAAAPELRVVVTSRSPLSIPGERVVRLEPLGDDDARTLLQDRAGRSFEPRSIAPLLARLDGLPLAIELFAAHARWMEPADLVARLDGRLASTSDGRRDRPPRHATLRACLEASWELLDAAAREALLALSSFETTFDADAADAVGGPGCAWTVPGLADLGLVRPASGGRWRLPAATREWVRGTPDAERRVGWSAHAEWAAGAIVGDRSAVDVLTELLSAIERVGADAGPELARALGQALYDLHPKIGAAAVVADRLDRLRSRGGPHAGRLALQSAAVRRYAAPTTDLRVDDALEAALADAEHRGDDGLRADALAVRGLWRWRRGEAEPAVADLEQAAHLAQSHDLPQVLLLGHLSRMYRHTGRVELGLGTARRALAVAREREPAQEAEAAIQLASVARASGSLDEARALAESAVVQLREAGRRGRLADALNVLGTVLLEAGRPAAGAAVFREAVALHGEHGNVLDEAAARMNLANAWRDLDDLDEAEREYRASLAASRAASDRRSEAFVLVNLGSLHLVRGSSNEGRALLAQALSVAESVGQVVAARWAHLEHARASAALGEPDAAEAELRALPRGVDFALDVTRDLLLARLVAERAPDEAERLLAGAEQAVSLRGLRSRDVQRDLEATTRVVRR